MNEPIAQEVYYRPLSAPSRYAGQISISADGRQIAYFEITAKLGDGRMGEVFTAEDTRQLVRGENRCRWLSAGSLVALRDHLSNPLIVELTAFESLRTAVG